MPDWTNLQVALFNSKRRFARRKRLLQKIIEAEQLDKLQRKPRTAKGFFVLNANAACVDFNPLGFELIVVEWIVVELIVVEQSGLNELRFAFVIGWALAFRCIFPFDDLPIFPFGELLDAATGTVFQLTEIRVRS